MAVLEYETGRRIGSIAVEHGVTSRTVMYWVNNLRRKSVRLGYVRAERDKTVVVGDTHVPNMTIGTGGKMTDKEVQDATLRLEIKIVALQAKLGWLPFEYRKEVAA